MRFMLDTNTCIFLIRRKHPRLLQRIVSCIPGDLGVSAITLAELEYGVAKSSQRDRNRNALAEFLLPFEIALFDEEAARTYGAVRAHLESKGTPIGSLDTLIGAHALSRGITLITNNTREFKRIPRLQVADWSR
jgi:tRNA(fMet)-specific endonuclease VapC